LDQKVIRRERFGVAGKILQIGKEHGEEPRLDAGSQRNARLDQLPDHIERDERRERFQRCSQQRSCRFQLGDLLDIRRRTRGRIEIEAFNGLQLPRHIFDRTR
jgi:hypothetical protein